MRRRHLFFRTKQFAQALEAGMPLVVLAYIGRRALVAVVGRGAVVVGEPAGLNAGSVVVEITNRVRQPIIIVPIGMVAMMMPCLRERGRDRDCRQNDGGCEKLYSDHLVSPTIPPSDGHFRSIRRLS